LKELSFTVWSDR